MIWESSICQDVFCSRILTVPVYVPVWWGCAGEAEVVVAAVEEQDSLWQEQAALKGWTGAERGSRPLLRITQKEEECKTNTNSVEQTWQTHEQCLEKCMIFFVSPVWLLWGSWKAESKMSRFVFPDDLRCSSCNSFKITKHLENQVCYKSLYWEGGLQRQIFKFRTTCNCQTRK